VGKKKKLKNMKSGDLVTLTYPHWDKKNAYFICRVREYVDHRERIRIEYVALKRVAKAKNIYSKDIFTETNLIFNQVDVANIELYKCDDSGIQCNKCELCYYGEDFRDN